MQTPKMQLEDLFAQFGGYLGLLTGVSVITVLEFVEVFVSSAIAFLVGCAKNGAETEAEKETERGKKAEAEAAAKAAAKAEPLKIRFKPESLRY